MRMSLPCPFARRLPWVAVLLLAAVLRLIALQDVPPGLSQDEVLDADIAEGILQGRHALFFPEGYGHEPLYHYYAAGFQALIGDNVLGSRLPSAVLGLLLVALTMGWARRTFGAPVALTAGLGLAVSWWPIIFSRLGIRPILLPIWLLAALWHWPRPHRRPWRSGFLLALGSYTYTPGVVFLALPPALWALDRLRGTPPPRRRDAWRMWLAALLTWLPLAVYLRANPGLLERADQLSGPAQALLNGEWRPLADALWRTLGVFAFTGDPRWTYTLPDRPLFDLVTALLFAGGVWLALRLWREPGRGLLLVWLAFGLLPAVLTPDTPSTIRMIGALTPTYTLVGLALGRLWQWAQTVNGRRAFALLGGLLLALNLWRTVDDGFRRWPQAFQTRAEKYQTVYLEMAHDLAGRPGAVPVVAIGAFAPIDDDSLRRNLGRDPQARWVQAGSAVVLPAASSALLYVPEYAPLDAALWAALGRSAADPLRRTLQPPGFAVYSLPTAPNLKPLPAPLLFGDLLTLRGYWLLPRADAGQPQQLLTWWQVERPLPADLALFVHRVPAAGQPPVAQHDGLDAAPTTLRVGDQFVQLHTIPAADGAAVLTLGVYTRGDGRRLPPAAGAADYWVLPEQE